MPNIEIKAKHENLKAAREIAQSIQTSYLGWLHQVDTYFNTKEGKLKLRVINDTEAQLIPYYKDYSKGPMKSDYTLLPVDNPEQLKNILTKVLGLSVIVDKKREVFLVDNIRIHLDSVENLGTFIEFEAVYNEESEREKEVKKVQSLMEMFQIKPSHLLDRSYVDYISDT